MAFLPLSGASSWLLEVIVLCFSTMMYIVEPADNINSLTTAMYICTVTVTTVGYGDVTPKTNAGRALAGVLCFISVLFMAMPISVLGNAMTHAWADRSRILLMTRTRSRLKNYGYEACGWGRNCGVCGGFARIFEDLREFFGARNAVFKANVPGCEVICPHSSGSSTATATAS